MNSGLEYLKQSLENLDEVWEYFSKKYGDVGAGKILKTKMMIHAMGEKDINMIKDVGDKVALINGITPDTNSGEERKV